MNESLISSSDLFFMIGIQVFLLAVFIMMILYICRIVKQKDPQKSSKKTCILVWFISTIAWFIIAQIVWIITYTQFG